MVSFLENDPAASLSCALCRGSLVNGCTILSGHTLCVTCMRTHEEDRALLELPEGMVVTDEVPWRLGGFGFLTIQILSSDGSEAQKSLDFGKAANQVLQKVMTRSGREDGGGTGKATPAAPAHEKVGPVGASEEHAPKSVSVAMESAGTETVVSIAALKIDLEDVTCPICNELFFEPTTLACGHSLCRPCLARALDHAFDSPPSCCLCRANLGGYLHYLNRQAAQKSEAAAISIGESSSGSGSGGANEEGVKSECRDEQGASIAEGAGTKTGRSPVGGQNENSGAARVPGGETKRILEGAAKREAQRRRDLLSHGAREIPICGVLQEMVCRHFPDEYEKRRISVRDEESAASSGGPASSATGATTPAPNPIIPVFVCNMSVPGVEYSLHVFEPRYRLMMRRCIESGQGVYGMHPGGSAPYGTLLRIDEFEQLRDGRSLLVCTGVRRFEILKWGEKDGYATAEVAWVDDEVCGGADSFVTPRGSLGSVRDNEQHLDHAPEDLFENTKTVLLAARERWKNCWAGSGRYRKGPQNPHRIFILTVFLHALLGVSCCLLVCE